ncbi:MAG: cyclic nucleotide-binding domain-containing protein [Desulfovibrionaceae bacterium]
MISRLSQHYIKNPAREAYPLLREIPFFRPFKENEHMDFLVKSGNWLKCPPNVEIIKEKENDRTFFVVISGKLSVLKSGRALALLRKGELFGEMGALLGEARCADVLTMEETMLYEGNIDTVKKFPPHIIFPFMLHVFSITAKRLKAADRRLASL